MPAIIHFPTNCGGEMELATLWKMEMQYYGKMVCNFREKRLAKNKDLYENIRRDICNYETGELDVTVKTRPEYLREELEHLKGLYIERLDEIRDLRDYITELEHKLSEHGLESPRMADERLKTRSSEI